MPLSAGRLTVSRLSNSWPIFAFSMRSHARLQTTASPFECELSSRLFSKSVAVCARPTPHAERKRTGCTFFDHRLGRVDRSQSNRRLYHRFAGDPVGGWPFAY